MQALKQSLEHQRKELNDCRAEITSLKMHIEGSRSGNNLVVGDVNNVQSQSLEKYEEEIKKLQMEVEQLKEKNMRAPESGNFGGSENEILPTDDKVIEIHEDRGAVFKTVDVALGVVHDQDAQLPVVQTINEYADTLPALFNPANINSALESIDNVCKQNDGQQVADSRLLVKSDSVNDEPISEKTVSPFYFLVLSCLPFLNLGKMNVGAGFGQGLFFC